MCSSFHRPLHLLSNPHGHLALRDWRWKSNVGVEVNVRKLSTEIYNFRYLYLRHKFAPTSSLNTYFNMAQSLNLSPRQSGEFVTRQAKHVSLHDDGVQKISKEILDSLRKKKICVDNFSQHELHPQTADDAAIGWIFLVDALNFSFWTSPSSKKKWEVTYRGKAYTGYFGLCAAINRAVEEGIPILDPNFYSKISRESLEKIFRSDNEGCEIPLIEERVTVLHQVGKVLLEKYQGTFATCIKQCNNSAQLLLKLIVSDFVCFNDTAEYAGSTVAIHKRAQILIGDIWACFRGTSLGKFEDIDSITMFADYRVPQVLVHYGVMKYSDELMAKLKSSIMLENGSPEEVEIRACSIHAVELITAAVKEMKTAEDADLKINAILIDHFLWDYRRQYAEQLEVIPFHLTRCIYY